MKRYTVYVPDEEALLIDEYKDEFNLSQVARDAILRHVEDLRGSQSDKASNYQRSIAEEIASSGEVKLWRGEIEHYKRAMLTEAAMVGARFLLRLYRERVLTPERVLEIESRPRNQVPTEFDRELLHELAESLNRRDVPEEYKLAARKSFRDTLSRALDSGS